MKLSEWARRNGVHYQTAYRWFRSGALPVPARKLPTGTILVEVPLTSDAADGSRCTRGWPPTTSVATWTGSSAGWPCGLLGKAGSDAHGCRGRRWAERQPAQAP